jgi:hypothetical protein
MPAFPHPSDKAPAFSGFTVECNRRAAESAETDAEKNSNEAFLGGYLILLGGSAVVFRAPKNTRFESPNSARDGYVDPVFLGAISRP